MYLFLEKIKLKYVGYLNSVFYPSHSRKLRSGSHAGEEEAVGDDVALYHSGVYQLLADFLS